MNDLTRLLRKRMGLSEIKVVWFGVFGTSLDDDFPGLGLDESVIELCVRAEQRKRIEKLHEEIVKERADLAADMAALGRHERPSSQFRVKGGASPPVGSTGTQNVAVNAASGQVVIIQNMHGNIGGGPHPGPDQSGVAPALVELSEEMIDAVVLTALAVEFTEVKAHLRNCGKQTHKPTGTIYEVGEFQAQSGIVRVAIAEIGAGNAAAAAETERALNFFSPSVALFVGVAGGVKDISLGDVVAATKVYGYEAGKTTREKFLMRPDVAEASHALVQQAKAARRDDAWRVRVKESEGSKATVHVGPIAAGEKVIVSNKSAVARFLKENYNDALAVEMEGRGFLKAAHANQQIHAMVIRGVSDLLSGKSKTDKDGWQRTAARNASAFAFEVLAQYEFRKTEGSNPQ